MVERDLRQRGIGDPRVLAAMATVPRERFVAPASRADAYADRPLPIGDAQTISQPYMVALMCQVARIAPTDRVLEIGTGSGYHAAVLAALARHVWSIERIGRLAREARGRLRDLDVDTVTVIEGNGWYGYADAAPYDVIVVAAATPTVPPALTDQLAEGGRLVIPLGEPDRQDLTVLTRAGTSFERHSAGGCRFVPFIAP